MSAPNNIEIERKFLLKNDAWKKDVAGTIDMVAGYLSGTADNKIVILLDGANSAIVTSNGRDSFTFPVTDFSLAKNLYDLKTREPLCTIRIRMENNEARFVFKGKPPENDPLSRAEYDFAVDAITAKKALHALCPANELISKTRHLVPHAGKKWEIDVFHGKNTGLVVAEIELSTADEKIVLPDWAGEEVSLDFRYSNSALAKLPYSEWCAASARNKPPSP